MRDSNKDLDSLEEFENIMNSASRYSADLRWFNRTVSGMTTNHENGRWIDRYELEKVARELAKARVELRKLKAKT